MGDQVKILIYISIGLFSGFMSGMFGIGGGSIRTPLLYASGLPLLSAYGINLVVIPFSSIMGAITHRKNLDKKIAIPVIGGGMVGTITGALLIGNIASFTLSIIFVCISVITVIGIHFRRIFPELSEKIRPKAGIVTGGAFILNFLTILRGGSGGSLFPPFLRMIGLDVRKAIATSLFTTIFTATAGALVFWSRGDVPPLPAILVITGSILGARLGSLTSLKTKPLGLDIGLSLFVVALASLVLVKSL